MATPPDPFGTQSDKEFTVDLTNASQDLPVGTYKMRCENVQQDVSKANSAPMLVWDFTVIEGTFAGRKLKQWTSLTEAAQFKIAETLIALGLGRAGERVSFTRSQAVGRICLGHVTAGTYQGQPRNSLSKCVALPADAGAAGPVATNGAVPQQQVVQNALP